LALLVVMLAREPLSWRQLASLGLPVWLSLGMIAFLCQTSAMLLFFWVIQRVDLTHAALSI